MKKVAIIAASLTLGGSFLFGAINLIPSAHASNQIDVYVDGSKLSFDVEPQLKNDRTFVPMRAIFERLGATLNWDQESQSVFAFGKGNVITLQVGKKNANANGKNITLDAEPFVDNDRTLVPLRFVSEAMGAKVDWKQESGALKIYITSGTENKAPETKGPQFTQDGKPIDQIQVPSNIFNK